MASDAPGGLDLGTLAAEPSQPTPAARSAPGRNSSGVNTLSCGLSVVERRMAATRSQAMQVLQPFAGDFRSSGGCYHLPQHRFAVLPTLFVGDV
jgi:hypothetical protein